MAKLTTLAVLLPALLGSTPPPKQVDLRQYIRPSSLVRVAKGRRINVLCQGSGAPAVFLIAGIGDSIVAWRHVQAELAKTSRVCSYDRAGLGFSDPATQPSDIDLADADLSDLIRAEKSGGAVVLVGHSLGGLIATSFAARHHQLVGGLVLVDPVIAGEDNRLDALLPADVRREGAANRQQELRNKDHCLEWAKTGMLLSPTEQQIQTCLDYPPHADEVLHRVLNSQYSRLSEQEALSSEWRNLWPSRMGEEGRDSAEALKYGNDFGRIPLVLIVGEVEQGLRALRPGDNKIVDLITSDRTSLAARSSEGRLVVVRGAGHYIQHDKPWAVVNATRWVVARARTGAGPTTRP